MVIRPALSDVTKTSWDRSGLARCLSNLEGASRFNVQAGRTFLVHSLIHSSTDSFNTCSECLLSAWKEQHIYTSCIHTTYL